MKRVLPLLLAALLATVAPVAGAAIEVSFIEDAPKDRFVIVNHGACAIAELELEIDLGPSAGRLYFDTSGAGPGVQVFQPFEVASGALRLVPGTDTRTGVEDGRRALTVELDRLEAGARAEFTIVGGALGQSRIAPAEIAGARVRLRGVGDLSVEGHFDTNANVSLAPVPCPTDSS
jgi:hypothetical protein